MCGHVGIAGNLEFKDEGVMKRLFIQDYFRGPDSTGLAVLRKNGDSKIVKLASHPIDLFDTGKFKEALSGHNSSVFLGHNRLATKGVVNGVNAHPYEYDHIIGAHNGTLDRSSWSALEEATGEKFDVDSQAIIYAIAKLGIEATVPLLQGAWSLVWINKQEGSLNFLRNDQRPMWFSYTKDFKKLFWASEWPMIHAAVNMTPNNKDELFEKEGYRFWQSTVDWWYKFDLNELRNGGVEKPKAKVKILKGKEPAPASNYSCGYTPFVRRASGSATSSTGTGGRPAPMGLPRGRL